MINVDTLPILLKLRCYYTSISNIVRVPNKNENRKLTNQRLRNTVTSNYLCGGCSFLAVLLCSGSCCLFKWWMWVFNIPKRSVDKSSNGKHNNFKIQWDQCYATYHYRLDQHKANIHQGLYYPCDQCEYVSKPEERLTRHKRSETSCKIVFMWSVYIFLNNKGWSNETQTLKAQVKVIVIVLYFR